MAADPGAIRALRLSRELQQLRHCSLSRHVTIHNGEVASYTRFGCTVVLGFPSRFPFVPPVAMVHEAGDESAVEARLAADGIVQDGGALRLRCLQDWSPSTRLLDVVREVDGLLRARAAPDAGEADGTYKRIAVAPAAVWAVGAEVPFDELSGAARGGGPWPAQRLLPRSNARSSCSLALLADALVELVPHGSHTAAVVVVYARPLRSLRKVALRSHARVLEVSFDACSVACSEPAAAPSEAHTLALSAEIAVYELAAAAAVVDSIGAAMRALGVGARREGGADDRRLVLDHARRRPDEELHGVHDAALVELAALAETMRRPPASAAEVSHVSEVHMRAVEASGALVDGDARCAEIMASLRAYLTRDDVLTAMTGSPPSAAPASTEPPEPTAPPEERESTASA